MLSSLHLCETIPSTSDIEASCHSYFMMLSQFPGAYPCHDAHFPMTR